MKWVALLRAVNLGARNKVPMAELRARLEAAGYEGVRTYIASGNVILDGPSRRKELGKALEDLVADAFGVATTAILRKPRELVATLAGHPFGSDTSETYVAFLAARPAKSAVARLEEAQGAAERAVVDGAEVYLRLPRGVHSSGLSVARVEKLLGVQATLRNWRTVAALVELAAEA
jgi:uncharacterized protein (DUF1697 family)